MKSLIQRSLALFKKNKIKNIKKVEGTLWLLFYNREIVELGLENTPICLFSLFYDRVLLKSVFCFQISEFGFKKRFSIVMIMGRLFWTSLAILGNKL